MSIDSIKKYFKKNSFNNTIGHAYLFSNVTYEKIKKDLDEIIKKYIFNKEIELENRPDFYIIEPEKNVIKKEKILELEQELIKTSQTSDKKMYIINKCDTLNSFSANSLLKTLEEPSSNVYAFLLTDNLDKVYPTIKSRCQIIYCDNEKIELIENEEELEKTLYLIDKIEKMKTTAIAYENKNLYKKFDKEELKKVLTLMEFFYKDCINEFNGIQLEYFKKYNEEIDKVIKKNDEKKIIKKIIIINKNLNLLEYNLNLNLFIDKILIELGRV